MTSENGRPDENGRDLADASVGQLVGLAAQDLSTLMRQEIALAKAEMKREAIKAGRAYGMFGGAGFAGYMVLLFLSLALWAGLSNAMDAGWAALIVAAVWGAIAAVLASKGRTLLRTVHPKPERTVETLQQVPQAFTNHRGERTS